MNKIKENKLGIIIGSLVLVTLIAIIYAVFTGTLNISGTANVRDSKWDIHIVESGQLEPSNITESARVLTKPTASTLSISDFNLSLTTPGDYIEYTFHIVNDGDYDATLSDLDKAAVTCTANGSTSDPEALKVCNKLEYTLKYENGSTVTEGDTLLSKETKTMVLKIKYQAFDDPSLLPTTNVSISGLGIDIQYSQSGNAKVNEDGTTPLKIYTIGEEVTVLNEKYNVIGVGDDYVTLLKQEPLTVEEVNAYGGVGTENNHVNRYTDVSVGTAYDFNDTNHTGGMAYYSSSTCGYPIPEGEWSSSGCEIEGAKNYNNSDVKYVIDDWATSKFTNEELVEVNGYNARLITLEELLPIGWPSCTESQITDGWCSKESGTPSWIWNSNYGYMTMTPYNKINSSPKVWHVSQTGMLYHHYGVGSYYAAVRPVINVYKSAIQN